VRILLTNDDSFQSEAYQMIGLALQEHHEVIMISPEEDCSGISSAFTLRKPVFQSPVPDHMNPLGLKNFYKFSGTPVDCVKFCLLEFLKENPPDVVVSGINPGANMACDVLYSGTVAAAMEAAVNGCSGIALSHHSLELKPGRIQEIIDWFLPTLDKLKDFTTGGEPKIININYPDKDKDEVLGERITRVGKTGYSDYYVKRTSPGGKDYYWLTGTIELEGEPEDSDKLCVESGYISISPLQLRFTCEEQRSVLERII